MARTKKAPLRSNNTAVIENPSKTAVIRLNNDLTLYVAVDDVNNVVNGFVLKDGTNLNFTAELGGE